MNCNFESFFKFSNMKQSLEKSRLVQCTHSGHSNLVRQNGILNLSETPNISAIFLEEFGKVKFLGAVRKLFYIN
jgi:hypothetical protein